MAEVPSALAAAGHTRWLIQKDPDGVDHALRRAQGERSAGSERTEWLLARRAGAGLRGALAHLALVLGEDDALHPLARLGVERVGDVLEGPVLASLGGHRDEEARVAVDHLQVTDDEAA